MKNVELGRYKRVGEDERIPVYLSLGGGGRHWYQLNLGDSHKRDFAHKAIGQQWFRPRN